MFQKFFKQFRLQQSPEEVNREFDLVNQGFDQVSQAIKGISLTPGPAGPTGAAGPTGPTGPTGPAGDSGGWQLALSYGFKGGSGALPPFESGGTFWLKPNTWDDISVVYSVPITDTHAPTEWEAGGSFSSAKLDVFCTDVSLEAGLIVTLILTKNGADTAIGVVPSAALSRFQDSGSLSISDGDRIGVRMDLNGPGSASPGSIWLTAKVKLS
jgi:hypothetical protein